MCIVQLENERVCEVFDVKECTSGCGIADFIETMEKEENVHP